MIKTTIKQIVEGTDVTFHMVYSTITAKLDIKKV